MKQKMKRQYVTPWMEVLEIENDMRLLGGSDGVNTIPNSDEYEEGGDPFIFS